MWRGDEGRRERLLLVTGHAPQFADAPVQTPAPAVSLRPPCACLVVEDPELREAALALLRGWLEQIEKAD